MIGCYLNDQPMTLNETEQFVYTVACAAGEKAVLRVHASADALTVRPMSAGMRFVSDGESPVLEIPVPAKLCVECTA